MFYCAICGISLFFIISQMFLHLEFVLQQLRYSNNLRMESSHYQCKCKQSLCYHGTGQALQILHVQVRHGGDEAPTLLGKLVSVELCSQWEIRISVLPGVDKPEQASQQWHWGSRSPLGAVCASLEQSLWYPSAEGADLQLSALLPSKPNSAVGGLTLT